MKLFGLRRFLAGGAAGAAKPVPPAGAAQLMQVVQVSARDRWQTARVSHYTPQQVEAVIMGAFSGDLRAQWEMFDLMEATWPRLQKNLNELKGVLDEHDWSLQAWAADGEQPDEDSLHRKRVVEEVIWHFRPDPTLDEGDFESMVRDLADAWGKGVSIQEIDWEVRRWEAGTLMGIRSTRWVHPRCYGYPISDTASDRLMLRTAELVPSATNGLASEWMPFPPDKFVVGIAKQKTGHAIGSALLRPLAWWWAVGNFTSEWLVNLAQVFGVPIRWATYAQGTPKAQIDAIEAMLENMGSAAWGAFPAGTTLELKEALKAGSDNPQLALLGMVDRLCDLLVLGQTLTSEAGDRGSQALGRVHADVLSGRRKSLLGWVVKTLNQQLIPSIVRLNFGDTQALPFFILADDREEDAKAVADTFEVALRSGIAIPRQYAYAKLGIPAPGPDDDVIPPTTGSSIPDQSLAARVPVSGRGAALQVHASGASQKLAAAVAESVTGIEAQWLGGALPWFQRLVEAAGDPNTTDDQFLALVQRAQDRLPDEVAPLLRPDVVARAMEANMGAACVNGAVQGYVSRRKKGGKA